MGDAARNRQKAKELGAADAGALVATVPYLARLLSKKEIEQIQTVLDAAVLNPMYQEQYNKARKDSVISRAGNMVLRNQTKERRARRILHNNHVKVSDNDHFIRVDYRKMLTADALIPRTNNRDEEDYLAKVRQVLDTKGVWLRLKQPWNPQGLDPRVWEFSFSLGQYGDTIETDDALINRDELLGTTMLGQGYSRAVLTGPIQTKIKQSLARLDRERDSGWSLHMDLLKTRNDTARSVVKISGWLGAPNIPDMRIWHHAYQLRMKAWNANTAGDVKAAQIYLVAAAHAVEDNAELLANYYGGTVEGANRVVKILKVAKTAGQVAEFGLMVTGVGYGIKALRAGGSKAMSREARHRIADKKFTEAYLKEAGITNAELTQVGVIRTSQATKTVLGRGLKAGQSSGYGTGFHKGW